MEFLKKIDFDYELIVEGNICEKFGACFLNRIELINHNALAHEEQHICEMYEAKFVSQIDLENHIESVHEGKKQRNC